MTYKQVLQQVGWPTDVLVLDFETYFDQQYSLKHLSLIEYITDKRFEFTGLGIYDSVDNQQEFFKPEAIYTWLHPKQFCWNERTVVMQNAKFDATILQTKFGIIPPYIIDIVDLARHYDARMSHHLKDLCQLFKVGEKGDTTQFIGLHWQDMSLLQRIDLQSYCLNDVDKEWKLFKILLPMLSNPEIEIPLARHTLKLYLEPKIVLDFKKAGELEGKMLSELENIIEKTGCTKKEIGGNLSFGELLIDNLPENESIPVKPGKPTKNMTKLLQQEHVILALAKNDEAFQELLVHPNETVRNLCLARQAVKSWPLHIKRIKNIANQADACNGLLPCPLNYYGGHTGRWSGGEGINLQNLGGRGRAGSGVHPLISDMRSMLTAPEGFVFAIADSAQIEARILAWLAGQNDLIEGFRNGEDIYSDFASMLFNSAVWKPSDADPEPIRKLLKIRRGFGKDAILGCGYGMGATKFYNRCRANLDLRPYFDSGEYNFAFIEQLIKTYRNTYKAIPEFWKTIESMFKWVIKYPKETISYFIDSKDLGLHYNNVKIPAIIRNSLLTLWNQSGNVYLQLPSGRTLIYRHCSIDKSNTIRWHWGHLWGGSLTENIVQAIARDLLGYWILKLEENNIPVVLHNHDEAICLVKENDVNVMDDILAIMRTSPTWADGLPLDAEGQLTKVYCK